MCVCVCLFISRPYLSYDDENITGTVYFQGSRSGHVLLTDFLFFFFFADAEEPEEKAVPKVSFMADL